MIYSQERNASFVFHGQLFIRQMFHVSFMSIRFLLQIFCHCTARLIKYRFVDTQQRSGDALGRQMRRMGRNKKWNCRGEMIDELQIFLLLLLLVFLFHVLPSQSVTTSLSVGCPMSCNSQRFPSADPSNRVARN